MIICHLCLSGPYTEGLGYQENELPKYHAKQGYRVYQVVTSYEWKGTNIVRSLDSHYKNNYGIEVIRLTERKGLFLGNRFSCFPNLYNTLCKIGPDILFIHDVQFVDARTVARFLKNHRQCRAYADNHTDYTNGISSWASEKILHGIVWRYCAQSLEPYVTKFYGVLPARVKILTQLYKLPPDKCELLVMGADDELVATANTEETRRQIRDKYNIAKDDFLIVTGGKINRSRPETLDLIRAVSGIQDDKIKLLIFGAVSEELKKPFDELIESSSKIVYSGWIDSTMIYAFFSAADLIAFPGLHSVMWEQAVAMGKPCIFKDLDGYHHVDLGGNAVFVKDTTSRGLSDTIQRIVNNPSKYNEMLYTAKEKGMKTFSYYQIAKKSIER